MPRKAKTSDALAIIRKRHYEGRPEREASLEEERRNAAITRRLIALRTRAGLTQLQLAQRVGTTASVISRLENADYEGHSLSMLRRVANALGKDIDVRFVARRAGGAPLG
ncbi:MAG: helix-turn-helix transcriptional regulator [FCB group bacterium]|jgi:DNA-binding XRE family transcriptional regulator|nr:helix-turn-helix transcriptional regulator [FCB group bacterium]